MLVAVDQLEMINRCQPVELPNAELEESQQNSKAEHSCQVVEKAEADYWTRMSEDLEDLHAAGQGQVWKSWESKLRLNHQKEAVPSE